MIYNGIDVGEFRPMDGTEDRDRLRRRLGIGARELVVGTVGRLARQKGFRYLLQASDMVRAKRKDVRFLIVGGDAHPKESVRAELLRLSKSLDGEEGKVIFTGHRTDMRQIVCLFDVFVLPSLWEGFGIVLLEAMSLGLPIVATSVEAIPELVTDGQTGILVPPRDPHSLAQAIAVLADSPALRQKYGQNGLAYARQVRHLYSWDAVGQRILSALDCLEDER